MTQDHNELRFSLLEITSEAKTKRRLEKTARASKKRPTLRGIRSRSWKKESCKTTSAHAFVVYRNRMCKKRNGKWEMERKGRSKASVRRFGCTSRKLVVTAFRHKPDGYSFDEVLRIIGLLGSISVRSLLHTLGVVIISAVTATPCSLEEE
jgi:hypothetical protein